MHDGIVAVSAHVPDSAKPFMDLSNLVVKALGNPQTKPGPVGYGCVTVGGGSKKLKPRSRIERDVIAPRADFSASRAPSPGDTIRIAGRTLVLAALNYGYPIGTQVPTITGGLLTGLVPAGARALAQEIRSHGMTRQTLNPHQLFLTFNRMGALEHTPNADTWATLLSALAHRIGDEHVSQVTALFRDAITNEIVFDVGMIIAQGL
ncbi:hypothetical protein F5B20DRAFT_543785 [Whalleya microplaca]|nr:hypothetical protein F5B20DRAFT_543785 [Whalleya microplaca]